MSADRTVIVCATFMGPLESATSLGEAQLTHIKGGETDVEMALKKGMPFALLRLLLTNQTILRRLTENVPDEQKLQIMVSVKIAHVGAPIPSESAIEKEEIPLIL